MSQICYFALDLVDDAVSIARYEAYHRPENAWPEVTQSLVDAGILDLEIYRYQNRMVMVVLAADDFDPTAQALADARNPKVFEWEALMDKYQSALPGSPGQKWRPMRRLYSLVETCMSRPARPAIGRVSCKTPS